MRVSDAERRQMAIARVTHIARVKQRTGTTSVVQMRLGHDRFIRFFRLDTVLKP